MTAARWSELLGLPAINSESELANWLALSISELQWLADQRGIEASTCHTKLRHYHYRPLKKRFGCLRLIESPKPKLKAIQQRVLSQILSQIPPHDAAHGFCRGRSIRSFAAPHQGKRIVIRLDLEDFFPSVRVAHVRALFRAIGYGETVSGFLAAITTNSTPRSVWGSLDYLNQRKRLQTDRYRWPHLPQGAPTSPAIANLAAYRLDCRLAGLAHAMEAKYTRYADDLAFSGGEELSRRASRFCAEVAAIVMDEGFVVHFHKTKIMRRGERQQLAGLVVNEHVNVTRREYERLKATLNNCVRKGAASQNHANHPNWKAQLAGRVAFVEMINPVRGAKLRRLLERIDWKVR